VTSVRGRWRRGDWFRCLITMTSCNVTMRWVNAPAQHVPASLIAIRHRQANSHLARCLLRFDGDAPNATNLNRSHCSAQDTEAEEYLGCYTPCRWSYTMDGFSLISIVTGNNVPQCRSQSTISPTEHEETQSQPETLAVQQFISDTQTFLRSNVAMCVKPDSHLSEQWFCNCEQHFHRKLSTRQEVDSGDPVWP